MESPKRTLAKTLTWQAIGLLSMTLIGYLVTGSVGAGGGIAAISAMTGAIFYVVHERLWARIRWGLAAGPAGRPEPHQS